MSLFNKIKTALFTEEEETVEIPVIKKGKNEEPHYDRVVERVEKTEPKDLEKTEPIKREVREENIEEHIEPKKAEKSPFQQFDEEEFDRIAAINKTRLLERDRKAREEKERNERIHEEHKIEHSRDSLRNRDYQKEKLFNDPRIIKNTVKEEEHHFKPSPVISPVYGILDKNYSKEDILPRASSDGTLPKVMDVDKVRQKAFGTLENLEKTMSIPSPEPEVEMEDIDVKITSFEDQVDDDTKNVLTKEDLKEIEKYTKEMDNSENLDNNIDETIEVEEPKKAEPKEDKVSDATLENELFNLIDSMYQDKEEE